MAFLSRVGTELWKDGQRFTVRAHGYANGLQLYVLYNSWANVLGIAINECKEYGFNAVRVWATGPPSESSDAMINLWQTDPATFWSRFDYVINQFRANGLYLVVCIGHDQAFSRIAGGELMDLTSPAYALYKQWVTDLCGRYKNEETILFWEVINEYPWTIDALAIAFLDEASTFIKSVDPNHLLTTGYAGLQYTTNPSMFVSAHDLPNIDITSFHIYTHPEYGGNAWAHDTKEQVVSEVKRWRDLSYSLDKPIFFGEFGAYTGFVNVTGFPDPRGYNSEEDNPELVWLLEAMGELEIPAYGFHAFAGYSTTHTEALVSEFTCVDAITQEYLGHSCPQNPKILQAMKTLNSEAPPIPPSTILLAMSVIPVTTGFLLTWWALTT